MPRCLHIFASLVWLSVLLLPCVTWAVAPQSDDFNATTLNTSLWTVVDPVGDSTVSLDGTRLNISVPAGVSHDVWSSGADAPHVMQAIDNSDFEIEAKFESALTQQYQLQGILVQQDASNFIRTDFYTDGSNVRVFIATIVNGSPTVVSSSVVSSTAIKFLRVTRSANQWTVAHSLDGINWALEASFSHALTTTAAGVFAGNAGNNPPAHNAVIDYFFNTASPIVPEDDGQASADTTPPVISAVSTTPGSTQIQVDWSTDEPATSTVEYGLTASYELGRIDHTAPVSQHSMLLSGLQESTTYNLRLVSQDASGNTSVSGNYVVTTTASSVAQEPVIDAWDGDNQRFGDIGVPQHWVNILGKVLDPDGIQSLSYILNGGASRTLSVGALFNSRLANEGDFNIDLAISELSEGNNVVLITAVDTWGYTSQAVVNVNFVSTNVWPRTYSIDWSTVTRVPDVAQVVDGMWRIEGNTVRTAEIGYDRLINIGHMNVWDSYEVTVPITVNYVHPTSFWTPAVGVLLRWDGHYNWTGDQPYRGWWPMGALGWYQYRPDGNEGSDRLSMIGGTGTEIARDLSGKKLALGVPYIFKMQVEAVSGQGSWYRLKVWQQGTPEPAAWDLQSQESISDPQTGSMLLLAHYVDASFGPVSVVPLDTASPSTEPPVISNLQVSGIGGNTATISWTTDVSANSRVDFGTSAAYGQTVSDVAITTSHSLVLNGLNAETTYHFQGSSTDSEGRTTSSADQTFLTAAAGSTPPPGFSDTFDGASLDPSWTIVDPVGDSTIAMTGTQLSLAVPGGISHDVWSSGNDAVRVMQATSDVDFELAVKFDSLPTEPYQLQGILVEQDAANFIRFDFYSDGSSLKIFAASFVNGTPTVRTNTIVTAGTPLYMRVERTGDNWTQLYSYDGLNWQVATSFNHTMVVSSVGIFAGNAGGASPAFTALVDDFSFTDLSVPVQDSTPPVVSGITVTVTSGTTADIGWTTDEPATTQLDYGLTTGYEAGVVGDATLKTSHSVSLTGLVADALHHFQVTAVDGSGNAGTSADQTFTPADIPPVISNIQVTAVGEDTATVSWTTDKAATSLLDYGLDTAYGTTLSDGVLKTSHSLVLTSLTAETTYHFQLTSTDSNNASASSADQTLVTNATVVTPPQDSTPPVVSGITVTVTSGTTADIGWTTDEPATTQLDYGLTTGYEAGVVNDATLKTSHSVSLTGLVADALHHFQVTAVDGSGNAGTSADQTFTPADIPPVISNIQVTALGEDTATVSWTTDKAATSLLDYGLDTAYGTTLSDGVLKTSHSLVLTGLTAETTYHFQLTSTDSNNASASSADQTLVTNATVVTPPPSGLSDTFDGASLDPRWTIVDPVGDSTIAMTGTQLSLAVPGGSSHDVWSSGNDAVRVMQATSDVDFELAVKFDSLPTEQYQLQGILVEQDPANFIRFDFYSDGSSLKIFAASFVNGTPTVRTNTIVTAGTPLYMRVERTGNNWTQLYSYDGLNWQVATSFNHTMVVSSVGIFAGNAGGASPAFTALVDDFAFTDLSVPVQDITPPVVSGIAVTVTSGTTADISWTTDEPATTQLDYGLTTGYEAGVVDDATLKTSHSVSLSGLVADTLHHFQVTAVDGSGNAGTSADQTFTPADIIPPVISNIQVTAVGEDTATVSWTTDKAATSLLDYGLDTAYGTTLSDAVLKTSHSLVLTGLTAETTYHFQLTSTDSSNSSASSADQTLVTNATVVTPPQDSTPPVVSGIAVTVTSGTTADISWTTDEPATTQLDYGLTTGYEAGVVDDATLKTSHSISLSGLVADTLHHFQVTAVDGSGNAGTSADQTFTPADIIPPVISNIQVTAVGEDTATVSWTTDKAATSLLDYGLDTAYGTTLSDGVLKTSHSLVLTGLTAETTYHFQLTSTDSSNASASSADQTLVTNATVVTPPQDSTPPVVSGIAVTVTSGTTADISWTTDEPATTQLDYGLTTGYEAGVVNDATLKTSHSVSLTGLVADTLYHFQVTAVDGSGNAGTSADQTFTPADISPVISNIQVTAVGEDTATVSWTTDKAATSLLDYGLDTAYGTTLSDGVLKTSHSLVLTGLTAETTYHFQLTSTDSNNASASSADQTLVTNATVVTPPQDSTPPVVSGIAVTVTSGTTADISWTTDEPATTQLDYGLTTGYEAGVVNDATLKTSHSVSLTGLVADTLYHFQVTAVDGSGNAGTSADQTFTPADISPVISNIQVTAVGEDTATVSWTTDKAATSLLDYGLDTAYGTTLSDGVLKTSHSLVLTGLTAETTYHFQLTSTDSNNASASSADQTLVTNATVVTPPQDSTPPVVSGIAVTVTSGTTANIGWTTDEPATTQLDYGLTTGYEAGVVGDATLKTSHSVSLTGLVADTLYHFQVTAVDGSGNAGTSGDQSFTPADIPPVISNIQVTAVGEDTATVSWTTDKAATSLLDYGLDTAYGTTLSDGVLKTSHSLVLTGLTAETTYHFQLTSTDSSNASASSADQTLVTNATVITPPPSGLSDTFDGASLDPRWTIVDPVGDSTIAMTGTQLSLAVPGGISHDVWSSGNDAVRVMQATSDVDFELTVKFDSLPTEQYQLQGILVEQGPANFIRFDFYSNGSSLKIFSALFVGGSPSVRGNISITSGTPLYMRIKREGDIWTQSYSYDSVSWTAAVSFSHTISVSSVGVFAGNADASPAFTALVDDFAFTEAAGGTPSP